MKRNFKSLFMASFLMAFVLLFLPSSKVSAYGLTQVNPSSNSVTVTWAAESKATKYTVYVGTSSSDAKLYTTLPASSTSATITGLASGTNYYVKVEYDYTTSYGPYTSTVGSDYYIKTTPGKVTGVKQDRWYYFIKSFNVKWDEQTAADGYEYQVIPSKGKKKQTGTVSYESLAVDNISNSVVYAVKVRAYATIQGHKYYGKWSDKCYCFTQPRISSAKVSKSKLTVKWSKVNGATGYDIYVSTKSLKGYKKVKSVGSNKNSVTITKFKGKKLSDKKKYYVYVVTKKKVGKNTSTSGRLYYWNTKDTSYGYF